MPNLNDKQLVFGFAVLLVIYWLYFLPFIGYFTFTGVRAYRRKWKSRFILRIVIPGALFCASWIAIGVHAWLQET